MVTTIQQSRRLLFAGVSHKGADAFYVGASRFNGNDYELTGEVNLIVKGDAGLNEWYDSLLQNHGISMSEDEGVSFLPAFSLAALWNIVHNLDKTYDFGTDMSAEELIEHLVTIICNRFNPKPIENED